MKLIPQAFLDALNRVLNRDSKEAIRLLHKIEADPDGAADKILHQLGTATQPIRLRPEFPVTPE